MVYRKLCHFYFLFNKKFPSYLFNLIPNVNRVHNTKLSHSIPSIRVRHGYFKNSFFLPAISEWNKLDLNIRNSASLNTFKKKLLNFIRSCANSIFDIYNPLGIKLLTRLHIGLSKALLSRYFESFIGMWQRYWINNAFLYAPTFSLLDKPSF